MDISDIKGEEIVRTIYKNELQKTNKKKSELKKESREPEINYMLKGKDTIICVIVGLMEKKHSINEWLFSRTEIFRKSET